MSFFKKLFTKKEIDEGQESIENEFDEIQDESNESSLFQQMIVEEQYENAPIFKKMMEDSIKEQNDFLDKFEKIVPIVKYGQGATQKVKTPDGIELDIPESSLPIIYPISFDNLSIVLGIDEGSHYEWLQNKHIDVVKDSLDIHQIVNKAYENLLSKVKDSLAIEMLNENIGILTNCYSLESSFILVPEIWAQIKSNLKANEVVFGIPTQDVFIFCNSELTDSVNLIEEKVKSLYNDPTLPKRISPNLYLKKENGQIERINK